MSPSRHIIRNAYPIQDMRLWLDHRPTACYPVRRGRSDKHDETAEFFSRCDAAFVIAICGESRASGPP